MLDDHLGPAEALLVREHGESAGVHRPHDAVRAAADAEIDHAPQSGPVHLHILVKGGGGNGENPAKRFAHQVF